VLIDFNAMMRPVCFSRDSSGEKHDVPGICLADRIGRLMTLSAEESSALAQLEDRGRLLRRGSALLRLNDRAGEMFLLRRGTAMSYVLLRDGSRQILRFHFPGDILGWSALAFRHSLETVVATSDAEVAPFDRTALIGLMTQNPRLGAAISALAQLERQVMSDRLATLGRTDARGRVAALLIEMRDRMSACGMANGDEFQLGLTQEEMGDAVGLTAVHVNRMLRLLEEEQLIARAGSRVTVLNHGALAQMANYVDRNDGVDLEWLAPAR
jgi:CRP/FNR family transcriptional regulator